MQTPGAFSEKRWARMAPCCALCGPEVTRPPCVTGREVQCVWSDVSAQRLAQQLGVPHSSWRQTRAKERKRVTVAAFALNRYAGDPAPLPLPLSMCIGR